MKIVLNKARKKLAITLIELLGLLAAAAVAAYLLTQFGEWIWDGVKHFFGSIGNYGDRLNQEGGDTNQVNRAQSFRYFPTPTWEDAIQPKTSEDVSFPIGMTTRCRDYVNGWTEDRLIHIPVDDIVYRFSPSPTVTIDSNLVSVVDYIGARKCMAQAVINGEFIGIVVSRLGDGAPLEGPVYLQYSEDCGKTWQFGSVTDPKLHGRSEVPVAVAVFLDTTDCVPRIYRAIWGGPFVIPPPPPDPQDPAP